MVALGVAREGEFLDEIRRCGLTDRRALQSRRARMVVAAHLREVRVQAVDHGTELERPLHGRQPRVGLVVPAGKRQHLDLGGREVELRWIELRCLGVALDRPIVLAPALVDDAHEVVRLGLLRVELGALGERVARILDPHHLVQDASAQQVVRAVLREAHDRAVGVRERLLELARVEALARLVIDDLRTGAVVAVLCLAAHLLRVRGFAAALREERERAERATERAADERTAHGAVSLRAAGAAGGIAGAGGGSGAGAGSGIGSGSYGS
jgi:hypothetical protein